MRVGVGRICKSVAGGVLWLSWVRMTLVQNDHELFDLRLNVVDGIQDARYCEPCTARIRYRVKKKRKGDMRRAN